MTRMERRNGKLGQGTVCVAQIVWPKLAMEIAATVFTKTGGFKYLDCRDNLQRTLRDLSKGGRISLL